MLAHLRQFRALHRYASDVLRREAGDHTARFYQIVARAEGNRDRLTSVQESELFTILEQAGKRQDFHLFNRVQKLALGQQQPAPCGVAPSPALRKAL